MDIKWDGIQVLRKSDVGLLHGRKDMEIELPE